VDRRRELKEQYKQMKPEMGIILIKSKLNNKCYIEATKNLKGTINGTKFKLNAGSHRNKELQRQWRELGEDNFSIEILEKLEYDEDESKIDYSEELKLLELIWEERLLQQNMEFFR
jgi:hypothetical protein